MKLSLPSFLPVWEGSSVLWGHIAPAAAADVGPSRPLYPSGAREDTALTSYTGSRLSSLLHRTSPEIWGRCWQCNEDRFRFFLFFCLSSRSLSPLPLAFSLSLSLSLTHPTMALSPLSPPLTPPSPPHQALGLPPPAVCCVPQPRSVNEVDEYS